MGNVIVVTSGKGGVGKTTVTANLGCALAKLGEKVCLIDADIGLKNLDIVLGLENRIVYTLIDVVNGKVSPGGPGQTQGAEKPLPSSCLSDSHKGDGLS